MLPKGYASSWKLSHQETTSKSSKDYATYTVLRTPISPVITMHSDYMVTTSAVTTLHSDYMVTM